MFLFGNKNGSAFCVRLNLIILTDLIFEEGEGCTVFHSKLVKASDSECKMEGKLSKP